jgi:uncharacterized protein YqgV (UPF0045/DUF77 family)
MVEGRERCVEHWGWVSVLRVTEIGTTSRTLEWSPGEEGEAMIGDEHVLAEISVEPAASGDQHHELVNEAIKALRAPGLVVTVGAMSTTVEGLLEDVLAAIGRAHRLADTRSDRVITSVRIESRHGGLHLRDRESELAGAASLLVQR